MSCIHQLQSEVQKQPVPFTRDQEDISTLFEMIPDYEFRYRLLRKNDPVILARVLVGMRANVAAQALIMMRHTQRLLVLDFMTEEERGKLLVSVARWQELSFLDDWFPTTMIVTDVRIVTKAGIVTEVARLPRHFPPSMKNCYVCSKSYKLWSSVNADCSKHSYCDGHQTGAICAICSRTRAHQTSESSGGTI